MLFTIRKGSLIADETKKAVDVIYDFEIVATEELKDALESSKQIMLKL